MESPNNRLIHFDRKILVRSVSIFAKPYANERLGNHCFNLAFVTDHTYFLFIFGSFCKHTEIQQTTNSVLKIYNNISIVKDVRSFAVVFFTDVVDRLRSTSHDRNRTTFRNQTHQVKEMTTLLHKGATSVDVESIPVINFFQKWIPMLAYRNHFHSPDGPLIDFLQHPGRWRHETILKPNPNNLILCAFTFLQPDQFIAVCNSCAEWLFDKQVLSSANNFRSNFCVSVIRCSDHDYIC